MAGAYEEGKKTARPDAWIYKNRNSGLWNEKSAIGEYLKKEGIRTLLFRVSTPIRVLALLYKTPMLKASTPY